MLADALWTWPTTEQLARVLLLRDYNTRVVIVGTALLGAACGIVGTFMLLRKRALMADALAHATLPGIGLAFLVMAAAGGTGKSLGGLLLGASLSGIVGMLCILAIRRFTRLKEDAALGIVLSVFFGLGVVILSVIQKTAYGHAAGLESFIYGKTASMLAQDAWRIAAVATLALVVCGVLFKEFALLCFDSEFARTQGRAVVSLDIALIALVVAVTVIGLQAVGLILIIAMLIIPPAAARFWTDRLGVMIVVAAAVGAASGMLGAGLSALQPRVPAGAVIVLVATACFVVSMAVGPARGVLIRLVRHVGLQRRVGRQHLLRAIYELTETTDPARGACTWGALLAKRAWSAGQVRRLLGRARRAGLVAETGEGTLALTRSGFAEAARITRNHRLWELYLITHADIAPTHVDRDADELEHVLGAAMARKLESLLDVPVERAEVPASPHSIDAGDGRR